MPACTCAIVTLHKCRKIMFPMTSDFFCIDAFVLLEACSFLSFSHRHSLFEEARRERAFGRSPQQTGLKIMTLWLCLSFAALCLPLRNSSPNTHMHQSLGAALGCLCASSIIFLKYPKAVLICSPPTSCINCNFQYNFFLLSV